MNTYFPEQDISYFGTSVEKKAVVEIINYINILHVYLKEKKKEKIMYHSVWYITT